MIELIDFMMQHFLPDVTHNMHFGHIETLKTTLDIFKLLKFNFINLPSLFKDKSVISSIPTYFENN